MTKIEQLLQHLKEHGPCRHSDIEPLFPTIWNNVVRNRLIGAGAMSFYNVPNPIRGRGQRETVRVYRYAGPYRTQRIKGEA